MIEREQLKDYPELMALIEQEHTLEQVERITITRDMVDSYVDNAGMRHFYPSLDVHVTVVFTDGTAKLVEGPINYVPKSEKPEEQAE